jgi:hypothetical protein
LGYLNVGPQFRSIGAQSKDVNYNALPVYFDRITNAQAIRPLSLMDVVTNENIYNRTVSSKLNTENNLYNNALPFGIATFNRAGMYAKLNYKKDIDANISYHNLSEIEGQGTLALRKFSIVRANVSVPVNVYLKTKNKLNVQLGTTMQTTTRNSTAPIENIDYKNTQLSAGISYELFKDFELMGGYVSNNTKGNDFIADRNAFTEVTYFNLNKYDVQQNMKAVGVKYNFTNKIYLSTIYQQSNYTDVLRTTANFKMNQFTIIYNMLF